MLQVTTKDNKVTTFGNEFVWYKDNNTKQLIVYKDLATAKYFEFDDLLSVYVNGKEVRV